MIKKALELYDISHAQFVIMAILLWWYGQKKEVTQIAIVTMSKLDKMAVSKSLKKLVGMGLVAMCESQEDARAKSVKLTKSGVALAGKFEPIVEGIDEDFFAKLPKNRQKI